MRKSQRMNKPPFPPEKVQEIVDFFNSTAEKFKAFFAEMIALNEQFADPTVEQQTQMVAAMLVFSQVCNKL
jgi:hypothetical protein